MKTKAFRIIKKNQLTHAFDGEGARLYGGRWNSKGTSIVYSAGSRALAALEVIVHLSSSLFQLDFLIIELEFDSKLVKKIHRDELPTLWRSDQPIIATQHIGNQWLKGGSSPILDVPSSIIPEESNYLLNPRHPDFHSICIGKPQPFCFDLRLNKAKKD